MSATDELRRMLDERGVEWTAPNSILRDDMTNWEAGGFYYEAFEIPEPDGTFLLTAAHKDDLTPEQVIAATLRHGTCRFETVVPFLEKRRSRADLCECDRCGYRCARGFIRDESFKYCPNCGREVVSE